MSSDECGPCYAMLCYAMLWHRLCYALVWAMLCCGHLWREVLLLHEWQAVLHITPLQALKESPTAWHVGTQLIHFLG